MDDSVYKTPDDIVIDTRGYCTNIDDHFTSMPEVAKPLLRSAKAALTKIEGMLYSLPAFFRAVRASVPEATLHALMTDEQKSKLAKGVVKLMTRNDGSLMANLVNPKTHRIVSAISLKSVKATPDLSQAMTNYATQMQMAQIAEQIRFVQIAVEGVRQGQEYDRLATAYSCQQKLLLAMTITNPELKAMALLRIANDAEDSRNLLMQSQNANVSFITNQPESFWGKFFSGVTPDMVDSRIIEIRENLCAVNMVSFAEAMAYMEMGEREAARQSLQYYADYIKKTYLETKGLVERLDLIDPSPENYWSKALPDIEKKIQALPCTQEEKRLGGGHDGD